MTTETTSRICPECERPTSRHALNCVHYHYDPADDDESRWVAITNAGHRIPFTLAPQVTAEFALAAAQRPELRYGWNLDTGFGADATSYEIVAVEREG